MFRRLGAIGLMAITVACSDATADTASTLPLDPPVSTTSTTTPTTTTSSSTTTTVPESTTTTLSEDTFKGIESSFAEGEVPDTSGDDFQQILVDLLAYVASLFEAPTSTDDFENAVVVGSAFDGFFRPQYEEQLENGWFRLPRSASEVRRASLESLQDNGTTALVLAVLDFDGSTTVDATGEIVAEEQGSIPSIALFTLTLGSDGQWRVSDVRRLGDAQGEED